jgi:hypothetical protein
MIVADTDDTLQVSVHKLETVISMYGFKVIIQIDTFGYLGCSVSYQNEKDIAVKISKFLKMTRIINKN